MAEKLSPENVTASSMAHNLSSAVKTDSSFWTLEDGIMHLTLQKRDKGQTWASPIEGQGQLDPNAADLEQKRLMLQRFQEEVQERTMKGKHVIGFAVLHMFCSGTRENNERYKREQ